MTITRPIVSLANAPPGAEDAAAATVLAGLGSAVAPADDAADSRGEPEDCDADGSSDTPAGVHAINPKQLDRLRDRFSVAGAKDDRRDARVAAAGLRTDPHLFRPVQASDPAVVELREWSRLAEELQRERVRLGNRKGTKVRNAKVGRARGSATNKANALVFAERLRGVLGELVDSPGSGQRYELRASRVELVGKAEVPFTFKGELGSRTA